MLSDGKWGLCDLARSSGRRAERGASWGTEDERENKELFLSPPLTALTLAFAFVSLTIIKSHRSHLPSLSISARLFCPGNAPIELPAEEARIVPVRSAI